MPGIVLWAKMGCIIQQNRFCVSPSPLLFFHCLLMALMVVRLVHYQAARPAGIPGHP